MPSFALAAIGRDRPGIVAAVAKVPKVSFRTVTYKGLCAADQLAAFTVALGYLLGFVRGPVMAVVGGLALVEFALIVPVLVMILARMLLKERLRKRFYAWAAVALLSASALSVPASRPCQSASRFAASRIGGEHL